MFFLAPSIETRIIVRLPSPKIAREYFACLEPELQSSPQGRATTIFAPPEDETLEFTINALDFTAARAAFNALIQYLRVIDETFDLTQGRSNE